MDIIIENSKQLDYHTQLDKILEPVYSEVGEYDWLLFDLDFVASEDEIKELPINFEKDYFILKGSEFKELLDKKIQFVWGVIIATSRLDEIEIDDNNYPFAESNERVWEKGKLQLNKSELEIICWDSSRTIIKCIENSTFERILKHFPEAKQIE